MHKRGIPRPEEEDRDYGMMTFENEYKYKPTIAAKTSSRP